MAAQTLPVFDGCLERNELSSHYTDQWFKHIRPQEFWKWSKVDKLKTF